MGPLFTIEQRVSATVQFSGASPTGSLTLPAAAQKASHVLWAYAALTAASANAVAGLFDPQNHPSPAVRAWRMKRIALSMGGQSVWRIDIIDQGGLVRVANYVVGTTETSVVTERYNEITLLPGETLKLHTTGMTAAGVATITFERA